MWLGHTILKILVHLHIVAHTIALQLINLVVLGVSVLHLHPCVK